MNAYTRTGMSLIGAIALIPLAVPHPAGAATEDHGPAAAGWTSRPPLHVGRVGAAAATVNGLIVETGGGAPDQDLPIESTEVRRTVGSGVWRFVADVPTPRANAAAATLGGKVWVVGGYGEGELPVDVVERYDPRTNAWSRGPTLPEGRAQAGAAVLHGVLYVVGGDITTAGRESITDTGLAFHPRQHRWIPIAPLPARRDRLRLIAAGDFLYAIGGEKAGFTSVSTVDRYDPGTGRWTSIAAMHETRSVPGATVVGHGRDARIAVIGGCQFIAGTRIQLRRTTEVFDPTTGRWRLLRAQLPTGRCSLTAATEADGTILAIGGVVPTNRATNAVDALRLR